MTLDQILVLFRLFFEFFKTGLFAVGGGLATIPFLQSMGATTGWFTDADLTTMIAVSESTPGPMGVNMATYVGFHIAGLPGAVVATLGLIAPCVIIILIVAGFLQRFRQSRAVDAVFKGLRPASTALIAAAGLSVAKSVLMFHEVYVPEEQVMRTELFYLPSILLAVAVFACMQHPRAKKIHPIAFIGAAAVLGAIFRM